MSVMNEHGASMAGAGINNDVKQHRKGAAAVAVELIEEEYVPVKPRKLRLDESLARKKNKKTRKQKSQVVDLSEQKKVTEWQDYNEEEMQQIAEIENQKQEEEENSNSILSVDQFERHAAFATKLDDVLPRQKDEAAKKKGKKQKMKQRPATEKSFELEGPPESTAGKHDIVVDTFIVEGLNDKYNVEKKSSKSSQPAGQPESPTKQLGMNIGRAISMPQDFEEEEEELSLTKLNNHVRQNHPKMSNAEHWPLSASTGSLVCFEEQRDIPLLLKDIGLGASLYLLTLKSFTFLFLIISLIKIPIFAIYMSGRESEANQLGGLGFFFSALNIGNIGESGPTCATLDFSQNRGEVKLACASGNLARLESLGMKKTKDQQCSYTEFQEKVTLFQKIGTDEFAILDRHTQVENATYFETYIPLEEQCSTYLSEALLSSAFVAKLTEEFNKHCKGGSTCTIPYDYLDLPVECLQQVIKRSATAASSKLLDDYQKRGAGLPGLASLKYELNTHQPGPEFFFLSYCESKEVKIFRNKNWRISKRTASYIIVSFDLIVLCILVIGQNLILHMQRDFAEKYDSQTVEARDFTVAIRKLPETFRQYTNESALKFSLWQELQDAIKLAKTLRICSEKLDPTIININVTMNRNELLNHSMDLNRLCDEIELLYIRLDDPDCVTQAQRKRLKDKITDLTEDLEELMAEHKRTMKKHNLLMGLEEEHGDVSFSDASEEAGNGWNTHGRQQKDKNRFFDGIHVVYITFLCMSTKDLVQDLYSNDKNNVTLKLAQYLKQQFKSKFGKPNTQTRTMQETRKRQFRSQMASYNIVELKKKAENDELTKKTSSRRASKQELPEGLRGLNKFFDKADNELEFELDETCDPEFILWENCGVTNAQRLSKQVLSWIVMLSIVVSTYFIIYAFKQYRSERYAEILPILGQVGVQGLNCQSSNFDENDVVTSTNQLELTFNKTRVQEGKITLPTYCFCSSLLTTNPLDFSNYAFADGKHHCDDWWHHYKQVMFLQICPSVIVQTINVSSTFLFITLARYESQKETTIMNRSIFILIFFQQFAAIGVVQIFSETTLSSFQFNVPWYMGVGSALCFTMMLNMISTKASEIGIMCLKLFLRCFDRGCRFPSSMVGKKKVSKLTQMKKKIGDDIEYGLARKSMNPSTINDSVDSERSAAKGSNQVDDSIDRSKDTKEQLQDENDYPNTRQLRQKDLQALYTGPQIESGEKFAQTFNIISITLMYSSGLPALYTIAFISFAFAYWFDKIMLMRYYQRTTEFNEELPIYSMVFMKFAFACHFVFGAWQLYNSDILKDSNIHEKHFYGEKDFDALPRAGISGHMVLLIVVVCLFVFFFLIDVWVYDFSTDLTVWGIRKYKAFKAPKNKEGVDNEQEAADADKPGIYMSPEEGPKFNSKGGKIFQLKEETSKEYLNTQARLRKQAFEKKKQNSKQRLSQPELADVPLEPALSQHQKDELHQQRSKSNQIEMKSQEVLKSRVLSDYEDDNPTQLEDLRADKNKHIDHNTHKNTHKLPQTVNALSNRIVSKNMMLGKRIKEIENDTAVVSDNYYAEILFDYLTMFYKKIGYSLSASVGQRERMRQAAKEDALDKQVYKKYCNYHRSIELRRKLMEAQIDTHYQKCLKIKAKEKHDARKCTAKVCESASKEKALEESRKRTRQRKKSTGLQNPQGGDDVVEDHQEQDSHSHSERAEDSHDLEELDDAFALAGPAIDPADYLAKIQYLDAHFDESELNQTHFPRNFRCKSFSQSYTIVDSAAYRDADLAVLRATSLLLRHKVTVKQPQPS